MDGGSAGGRTGGVSAPSRPFRQLSSSPAAAATGAHSGFAGALRFTRVVANSARVSTFDPSASALANLSVVLIAHSSKESLPSPFTSSLANALRPLASYSSQIGRASLRERVCTYV